MAKKILSQSTVATNNIQSQPDQVVDQASALKLAFDQFGIDEKQYNNGTLLPELQSETVGDSGSNAIGHGSANITANNVGDALEEIKADITGVVLGQIPDNSLTDIKLSQDVKIGSLATLNTTEKSSVTGAINEVEAETTQLDWQTATVDDREIQVSKPTTLKSVKFQLEADIVAGTVVSISTDGGVTSLPLKDIDEVDILELEKGFYEVIADATFFTLRPSGNSIPNDFDWSSYSIDYDWTGTSQSVASNSYQEFYNYSGEGFLRFVRGGSSASGIASNPDLRITVDGVEYVFLGDATDAKTGNCIYKNIYFKNSLKIEVFNRDGLTIDMECDYTILKKISNPKKIDTVLESSLRDMAANENNTTSDVDVVNISGSGYLLQLASRAYWISRNENVILTVIADGVNVMTNRTLGEPTGDKNKQELFLGPIRFETSLIVKHRIAASGSPALTKVWYTLD